jgi:hypothetical protein
VEESKVLVCTVVMPRPTAKKKKKKGKGAR